MLKILLLCSILLASLSEIVIIDEQLTHRKELMEYTEKLIEMSATNQVQTKVMTLSGRTLTCFIPIANHLLSDNKSREELPVQNVTEDSIRSLRHLCAIYRTREFLYQLCSGSHVRQFDDTTTIQNMGKKAPENIKMGNSKITESIHKLGRKLINSVPRKSRYLVIKDRVGLTNYKMPFSHNKYGVDRINVTCEDGHSIMTEIIVVSPTQFVLTTDHQGYCFSKVTHHTIQYGVFRIRLEETSFIGLGSILIGPCKESQSYALIQSEKGEITPYKIIERMNNATLILDQRIKGKNISCLPLTTSYEQVSIIGKAKSVRINGYVLKFDEDVDLEQGDVVLVSNSTVVDQQPILQKRTIDFSFTKRIFLLKHPLAFGYLLKSAKAYLAKTVWKDFVDVTLDLTQNEISVNVASRETNETVAVRSPVMRVRLEMGQQIKLNSSEVYVIVEAQGQHATLAKLTGQEWEYFVKGRPVKIKRYPNGSKEVVKENTFYQNTTFLGQSFHISQCIWADTDFAEFCRLRVEEYNMLTAMTDIYVTIFNLSSPENAHLRGIRKTRPAFPGRLVETYDNGERCGEPINADRTTQVEYICGDSWFTIRNVSETKPCQYHLVVETELLCEESFQHNAKSDGAKQTICTVGW